MNEVSVPRPRGWPRKRPEAVAGDRAYDADWIRQWCRKRSIESVIPAQLRTGRDAPDLQRPEVWAPQAPLERLVDRLKERRRLVVWYEKKASHYKAMLLWAFVREYLKR